MINGKIDIKDALTLLKSGYLLESFSDNNHYFFVFENGKINVSSKDFNAKLTSLDFLEIFKDYQFSPIKDEESNEKIDSLKDNEYYSKLQKKQ